jgi:hypothetical protein
MHIVTQNKEGDILYFVYCDTSATFARDKFRIRKLSFTE